MTGKVNLVVTDVIKTVIKTILFELFKKIYFSRRARVQKSSIFDFLNSKDSTHGFGLDRVNGMKFITSERLIN